jgi:hypothetical protein
MTIGVAYYRGQFLMTDRVPPKAANVDTSTEPSAPGPQPETAPTEATTPAAEQGEAETPAAQRRARLRQEIRAGMQRALKH